MQKFTCSDANFLLVAILSQIYNSGQTRVQIYINLFIIQRQAEFESLLGIPSDEVLLVVLLR